MLDHLAVEIWPETKKGQGGTSLTSGCLVSHTMIMSDFHQAAGIRTAMTNANRLKPIKPISFIVLCLNAL
jgi:hypothetical protein